MQTKQRWIGPDGDYYFEWETEWVLTIVKPDGTRINLTHEEGELPSPLPFPPAKGEPRQL